MIWLSWRQFRAQAAPLYAAVAAFAVVLLVIGRRLADLDVTEVYDALTPADRWLYNAGLVAVAVAPALVGAFWGAPLVARELEAGTHRLVWAQSVTRSRWLAAKLGLTALAAGLAVGVLTLAVSWWSAPLDGVSGQARGSLPARLTPTAFAMRGIVPVGYAVFALVLGVAVGLVLRRTVPAMALTLALFTLVQVTVPLWVRPHLATPVRQTVTIGADTFDGISLSESDPPVITVTMRTGDPGSWVLSDRTVDAAGRPVATLPAWVADCLPPPVPSDGASKASDLESCLDRVDAAGYHQRQVYQPASRFWTLQWRETGLFLALAGLLAAFCFWRTRRLS